MERLIFILVLVVVTILVMIEASSSALIDAPTTKCVFSMSNLSMHLFNVGQQHYNGTQKLSRRDTLTWYRSAIKHIELYYSFQYQNVSAMNTSIESIIFMPMISDNDNMNLSQLKIVYSQTIEYVGRCSNHDYNTENSGTDIGVFALPFQSQGDKDMFFSLLQSYESYTGVFNNVTGMSNVIWEHSHFETVPTLPPINPTSFLITVAPTHVSTDGKLITIHAPTIAPQSPMKNPTHSAPPFPIDSISAIPTVTSASMIPALGPNVSQTNIDNQPHLSSSPPTSTIVMPMFDPDSSQMNNVGNDQ